MPPPARRPPAAAAAAARALLAKTQTHAHVSDPARVRAQLFRSQPQGHTYYSCAKNASNWTDAQGWCPVSTDTQGGFDWDDWGTCSCDRTTPSRASTSSAVLRYLSITVGCAAAAFLFVLAYRRGKRLRDAAVRRKVNVHLDDIQVRAKPHWEEITPLLAPNLAYSGGGGDFATSPHTKQMKAASAHLAAWQAAQKCVATTMQPDVRGGEPSERAPRFERCAEAPAPARQTSHDAGGHAQKTSADAPGAPQHVQPHVGPAAKACDKPAGGAAVQIVVSMGDYTANTAKADQLSMSEGEQFEVLDGTHRWFTVRNNAGVVGKVPSNFLKCLSSTANYGATSAML